MERALSVKVTVLNMKGNGKKEDLMEKEHISIGMETNMRGIGSKV